MNQQIKILPCPGPKEVLWSQYVCYAVISDANSTKKYSYFGLECKSAKFLFCTNKNASSNLKMLSASLTNFNKQFHHPSICHSDICSHWSKLSTAKVALSTLQYSSDSICSRLLPFSKQQVVHAKSSP